MTDHELLAAYAADRSETAFAELVTRHAGWVREMAARGVGDTIRADDVTQAVFLDLTTKADRVGRSNVAGWLFRATRFAVGHARRSDRRRAVHERGAARPEVAVPTPDVDWEPLVPLLDELVDSLAARDREAVLLRFYRQLPLAEVGAALGTTEQAARARVRRAVEQLRVRFAKRGVTAPAADAFPAVLLARVARPADPDAVANVVRLARTTRPAAPPRRWPRIALGTAGLAAMTVAVVGVLSAPRPVPPPPPVVPIAPVVDETAVPGQVAVVRWDVLLTPAGGDALANIGRPIGGDEHVYHGVVCDAATLKQAVANQAAVRGVAGSDRPLFNGTGLPEPEPGAVIHLGGPFFYDNDPNRSVEMVGQLGGAEAAGPVEEGRPVDANHVRLVVDYLIGQTSSYLAIAEPDGHGQFATYLPILGVGIHCDRVLTVGQAVAFRGRFTTGSGRDYDHLMVWEAFKLDPADEMAVTREMDSVGWCRLGPGTLRGWSIAARARQQGGAKATQAGPAFTRPLEGGAIVRLEGLGRPSAFPFCLWDPQGRWLADPYYPNFDGDPPAGLWVSVAVSRSHDFERPWPSIHSSPSPLSDGSGTALPIGDHDTACDVGVLVGTWTEAGRITPDRPLVIGPATYRMVPSPGAQYWERTGPVSDDVAEFVTAVGPDGHEEGGHFAEYIHVRRPGAATVTHHATGYADLPGLLRSKDVKFYRLWRRRRQWVRFDGFATAPIGEPASRSAR